MFSYIHIPFCESKCKYCRFASLWSINKVLVHKYLCHLLNDIKNFKRPVENAGLLNSVYFWWGTPSILEINQLNEILETLKNKFWFEENIEITLESTPKNVTKENMISWGKLGINRLSMWIQTLNDATLQEIKRDGKTIILEALENIQSIFQSEEKIIQNISLDFIIWLPFVSCWETLKDIKYILENYDCIKHISVYMLEDYYVENSDDSHFEKITYPNDWKHLWISEDKYGQEYTQIKKYLETKGFFRYELSNFAKTGYECKHNKSYWNHSENVGFWLWSHSYIWGERYAYKDDFLWYYKWELEYIETLSKEDIFLEKIMFWLRTSGLTKDLYEKLQKEKIETYLKSWLLEKKDEIISMSETGVSLLDAIILELI